MALVHMLDQFGSLVEIHFKIKIGLVLNWHKMAHFKWVKVNLNESKLKG